MDINDKRCFFFVAFSVSYIAFSVTIRFPSEARHKQFIGSICFFLVF